MKFVANHRIFKNHNITIPKSQLFEYWLSKRPLPALSSFKGGQAERLKGQTFIFFFRFAL